MNNVSFPGLANIEAILRQIAGAIAGVNNTIADVFPPPLTNSTTWNPGNILVGASEIKTITVNGALLGMIADASFSLDVAGLTLTANVTASDTVTAILSNNSAGAVNLGSGTLKVMVWVS